MKSSNSIWNRVSRGAIIALFLVLFSSPSLAGWDDDSESVFQKIKNLKDEIDKVVTQMNRGKDSVANPNVTGAINAVTDLLGDHLPSQAEVTAFENHGCAVFIDDLTMLSDGLIGLSESLANFHGFPAEFQIQDPGLSNLLPTVPCRFLFPVEKIARKLPLFNSEFIYQIGDAGNQIDTLKEIVYPGPELMTRSTNSADIELGRVCEIVSNNETAIVVAHNAVRGIGLTSLGVGTVLQAVGKTFVTGPDQVLGAVWGWAGIRLKNNFPMTLGNFLSGSGHALLSISGATSRTRNVCKLRTEHLALQADHAELLATQQLLQQGQEEIIRLLLVPQGRRDSDFCHEENCSEQGFPLKGVWQRRGRD